MTLLLQQGLQVRNLKVRSLDIDSKEITWEIGDSIAEPLDYVFQVLRAESPGGPWDAISPEFSDRYIFVDRRLDLGAKYMAYWYKLRLTHLASGQVTESEMAAQQAEPDLIAQSIRRQELTLFTQVIGRACWLFKKRVFGPRCRNCWDSKAHKRVVDRCMDCFGTGMLRGYHNPIEIWVQVDPSTKSQQNNALQIAEFVSSSARTSFYPNIAPGDVLVEAENKRWRIQQVQLSERLRAPIKQELVMRQIEERDIEYRLPINLDRALRDVQASPVRMFTNATDINSEIDERMLRAFDLFMTYPQDPEEPPR